jgi:hypothetical protein
MPAKDERDARAELRSWYVHGLQPKLARAASSGTVDPRAVAALDADLRRLLDLSPARTAVRVAEPANAGALSPRVVTGSFTQPA